MRTIVLLAILAVLSGCPPMGPVSSGPVDIGGYPIQPNVYGPGIGMDQYGRPVVAVPY